MTKIASPLAVVLLALVVTDKGRAKSPLPPNTPAPDLTRVVIEDTSHTYHLGPTGARGWIHKVGSYASPDDFEGYFCTDQARQILITEVAAGASADGILLPGDVILGAGDALFQSDVRRALADAIDEAEREGNRGQLRLLRWRPDSPEAEGVAERSAGTSQWVTLQLKVLGGYSDTAPVDCDKADTIIEQTVGRILENGLGDRLHIGALGLLATGEERGIVRVGDFIRESGIASPKLALSVEKPHGMASWDWSYAALLLAEYHLLTGDEEVLPALETYVVNLAKGQAIGGTWGHKMADLEYNDGQANGRLTGYGALNQPAIICLMAMNLAVKCGIEHPELDRAIERSTAFYGYYAGKGAIPYGYDQPLEYMLSNNGMSGSAAIAFGIGGELEKAVFFTRMSAAAHRKTEIGHTGPYFGAMWTPLGANLAGPDTAAAFFREHRWLHTLARRWDGGFVYQPPGGRWGGSSESYYNLSSDGAHLLFYAAPRRKLFITGRNADPSLALGGDAAAEAVGAGLIDFPGLSSGRLMGLLGHPVPMVRRRAADALGDCEGDHLPQLLAMLVEGGGDERIGACHALAALGAASGSAAGPLLRMVGDADEDLWLRNRALVALGQIEPPLQPTAEALLGIVTAPGPGDPRGDLDMEIGMTLARLLDDPYGSGIDPDLFHAGINRLLRHPHHAARAAAMRMIAQVPLEHFHAVGDGMLEVIRNSDPAYLTYHHDGPRAAGLAILERLGIRDGIGLAMVTLEMDKWGQGRRVYGQGGRLALLARYGAGAQAVLPQLKEMRAANQLRDDADEYLQAIESATESRALISFEEAMNHGRQGSAFTR